MSSMFRNRSERVLNPSAIVFCASSGVFYPSEVHYRYCGIDLKVASKFFGQKFACGASITGDDEIVIQGDFKDDLFDLIPEKWPDIDEDWIEDIGTKKRT